MAKKKRRLTAAERRARRERKEKYMTIFINGRQKRVPRPPMIDGLSVDEFIARNADPIWLHQNELWELMTPESDPWLSATEIDHAVQDEERLCRPDQEGHEDLAQPRS